ncbi:MAG: hypothetical protein H6704_26145 [Myxococcales bacterium]|nr:hypothetical protein [Myxococcales bacterium]
MARALRLTVPLALLLAAAVGGCAPSDPPAPVASTAQPVRATAGTAWVVPDPGPPPHEAPPVSTLWRDRRAVARVTAVAPGAAAWVEADGTLRVDGVAVDRDVLPDLTVAPDGRVAYTKSPRRPLTDVWQVAPGGVPTAVTTDGRSDRPVYLPDGHLLWVSSAGGGVAGFFDASGRLTNAPGDAFAPVPAFPDRTRVEDGRVVFDAGDGLYVFDPAARTVKPR